MTNLARIDVHGNGTYVIEPDERPITKPRLRRNPLGNEYLCYGGDCIGWGVTEDDAYEMWLRRFRRAQA